MFWDYYNTTFAEELFTNKNITQLRKDIKTDGFEILKNSYIVGQIGIQQMRIKEAPCKRASSTNETCYEVNYNKDTMLQTPIDGVTMDWKDFIPAGDFAFAYEIVGHYGTYDLNGYYQFFTPYFTTLNEYRQNFTMVST